MKELINLKRVNRILKAVEDKDEFIIDLLSCLNKAYESRESKVIDNCLNEWEATAELCSIHGLKESTWRAYKAIRSRGLTNE